MTLSTLVSSLGSPLLAQDEPFIGSTMFFVLGGVIVLALIGALVFLRNKKSDDD